MYPSPSWLLEPAHDGPPTLEELRKYMAYLRYQLRRGVRVKHQGTGASPQALHLATVRRIDPLSVPVLQRLVEKDWRSADLTKAMDLPYERTKGTLVNLRRRGLVVNVDPGRYGLWRITDKGRGELVSAVSA